VSKATTLAVLAVVWGMIALFGGDRIALAQAGSTGGTIGKQDKSVSGGEEQPPTARKSATSHNSEREQLLPQTIRLTESSYGGTFSITLQRSGAKIYEGTYSNGVVTTFAMTNFTAGTVTMTRSDKPTWGAVTGTYVGHRHGNSATGHAPLSNGATVNWDASW
jgi:hypothetical protein